VKKFLFVVTKSSIGGAQMFIVEQTKMLIENGHEVFLITNKDGWLTQKLMHVLKNIYVHRGIEKLTSLSFYFKVYRIVKQNKIDLVSKEELQKNIALLKLDINDEVVYVTNKDKKSIRNLLGRIRTVFGKYGKGKKYKDHYATILSWARKEGWKDGNKNNGGVDDNLFLRTVREENDRATAKRLGKRPESVQGPGNSESGT
jgi:hypothetical protein